MLGLVRFPGKTSLARFFERMSESLRILWLKTGPLHPLDTGGKLRSYHLLRELKERHHVTYFALKEQGMAASDPILQDSGAYSTKQRWFDWREVTKRGWRFYLDLLANFLGSRRPYVIDKYRSRAMAEAIEQADRNSDFDLIICDFLTPAINLPLARMAGFRTPTLLFQHNVEAQIWQRMAAKASSRIEAWYLKGQYQRMVAFEARACGLVSSVVAVSQIDCETMNREYGLKNVLGFVPTGVDVDFFEQRPTAPESHTLVFLGSMDWLPNIDAVEYFVDEIWSRVRAAHPAAQLKIVGRRPTPAVRALAERDSSISVTGTVPDVRPEVADAVAVVVPLRVGGGTRIKIFEAMAMGVPVVSTTVGAEGLDVTDGENILIADTPESFAEASVTLLSNRERTDQLGRAAAQHVREHYSWPCVGQVFDGMCREVAANSDSEAGDPDAKAAPAGVMKS